MNKNWRETLPDPATSAGRRHTNADMRDEYARATQRDRARQMDARMRQALADDESSKSGRKWLVLVIVALLVLGAVCALTVCAAHNHENAAEAQEQQTEPMDGSNAGANAVTLEDLQGNAEEEYAHGWQSLTGYAPTWDVLSEGDGVTVESASDGPFYDLPMGWTSFTIHDRDSNRSYTVICTDIGTIAVVPTLDDTGAQVITERY